MFNFCVIELSQKDGFDGKEKFSKSNIFETNHYFLKMAAQ